MLVPAVLLLANLVATQFLPPVSAASDFAHLSQSVTPPRLVHSSDPEYTPQAMAAQIEGTVVLQVVISADGRITNASVLCPLPGGLEKKALEAIRNWRYLPGSMDKVDIPVLTTVDVVFRLPYQSHRSAPTPLPDGLPGVQLSLAQKYERDHNFNEAEHYYRLCAATADPACQYGIGKLLVSGPNINPTEYAQGIAWLELAQAHGNQQAAPLLDTAAAKLSSIQHDWVTQLKPHLEPRRR